MATRISSNPVWQIMDENNEVIASLNNDGGSTVLQTPAPNTAVMGTGIFVQVMKTTLTSAQLLALKATPLALIPAGGTNRITEILNITLRMIFSSPAYTLNAGTLKLFYGPVANALPLTADQAAILTAGANGSVIGVALVPVGTAASPASDTNGRNQPIIIANDGAAEYTLGAGQLEVIISYISRSIV
jgi:hypothetical protein